MIIVLIFTFERPTRILMLLKMLQMQKLMLTNWKYVVIAARFEIKQEAKRNSKNEIMWKCGNKTILNKDLADVWLSTNIKIYSKRRRMLKADLVMKIYHN